MGYTIIAVAFGLAVTAVYALAVGAIARYPFARIQHL